MLTFVLANNIIAQEKPNFAGTWLLDAVRSGREPTIWTQKRPVRFMLTQTSHELTLDTGDGSLFGVPTLVVEGPLRYRFDGHPWWWLIAASAISPASSERSGRRLHGMAEA
jgi:hypothetical protein